MTGIFIRILPLLCLLVGIGLDRTPNDWTLCVCMLAIGCFTFTTAIEVCADPAAFILGSSFVILISAWSYIQPAILNDRKLPIWMIFLPQLRHACAMVPIDGKWVVDMLRDVFRANVK